MLNKQFEWQGRIKDVDREFRVVRLALSGFITAISKDPTSLDQEGDVSPGHCRLALERLEATYFIRIFAEFEAALRDYWSSFRSSEPPARDLLEGITAARLIPDELGIAAHEVREHRNDLVHDPTVRNVAMSLLSARSILCKYVARLPPTW
jgi:hypothetical protein